MSSRGVHWRPLPLLIVLFLSLFGPTPLVGTPLPTITTYSHFRTVITYLIYRSCASHHTHARTHVNTTVLFSVLSLSDERLKRLQLKLHLSSRLDRRRQILPHGARGIPVLNFSGFAGFSGDSGLLRGIPGYYSHTRASRQLRPLFHSCLTYWPVQCSRSDDTCRRTISLCFSMFRISL